MEETFEDVCSQQVWEEARVRFVSKHRKKSPQIIFQESERTRQRGNITSWNSTHHEWKTVLMNPQKKYWWLYIQEVVQKLRFEQCWVQCGIICTTEIHLVVFSQKPQYGNEARIWDITFVPSLLSSPLPSSNKSISFNFLAYLGRSKESLLAGYFFAHFAINLPLLGKDWLHVLQNRTLCATSIKFLG